MDLPTYIDSTTGASNKKRRKKGRRQRRREDLISWRRATAVEQASKGRTQREIANMLRVGPSTINRDLSWFREKLKADNANFIEKIQEEHEKSMVGLRAVLKEAWLIIENTEDNKEKLSALCLVKDCYALQEDLACNLPIIDEALKIGSEGQEERAAHPAGGEERGGDGWQAKSDAEGAGEGTKIGEGEQEEGGGDGVGDRGEKKERKDDLQGSEKKVREDQERGTTNRTF